MLKIGLTGGIGSGKSTVTELFRKLGVPVIDADEISHEITRSGESGARIVSENFGKDYLDAEGHVDRAQLRQLVFENPKERERLEQVLHPLIRKRILSEARSTRNSYCILSIPLLLEGTYDYGLDRVLVVDAPDPVRIERVGQRSGLSEAEIHHIMKAQVSRETRLAAADEVIDNSGSIDALSKQVEALHRKYLMLADRPDSTQ